MKSHNYSDYLGCYMIYYYVISYHGKIYNRVAPCNIYMRLPTNRPNVNRTIVIGSTLSQVSNILTRYRYLTTERNSKLESNVLGCGTGECWNMWQFVGKYRLINNHRKMNEVPLTSIQWDTKYPLYILMAKILNPLNSSLYSKNTTFRHIHL